MAATSKKRETITAADCKSCGACCIAFKDQDVYCDVTEADEKRLGKKFVKLNVLRPTTFDRLAHALDGNSTPYGAIKTRWEEQARGPLKGREINVCVALRGSVMHKTSCAVYENRPDACRNAVKPGDQNCRVLRNVIHQAVFQEQEQR